MNKNLPTAEVAAYYSWARSIFEWFVVKMMRRDFCDVTLWGQSYSVPSDIPVIFVANHTSWWDGFFLWRLQRFLDKKRPVYSVMLAREYAKTMWFRWVGALPIEPGSPSSVRALLRKIKQLSQKSQDTKPIFSYFPQGVIKPSFVRPLSFASGLKGVVKALHPVAIVPIGIHIEPLCERHPRAFLLMGEPILSGTSEFSLSHTERVLTELLDSFQKQLMEDGEAILHSHFNDGIRCASLL